MKIKLFAILFSLFLSVSCSVSGQKSHQSLSEDFKKERRVISLKMNTSKTIEIDIALNEHLDNPRIYLVSAPNNGELKDCHLVSKAKMLCEYEPHLSYFGNDFFVFQIQDNQSSTETKMVSLNIKNTFEPSICKSKTTSKNHLASLLKRI